MVFAAIRSSRSESDAAALAAMEACPEIVEALGAPLAVQPLSLGCGESETGGGAGHASWSIGVRGPRGSASAGYTAYYTANGPWEVDSAWVELDGKTVDALKCVEPADPEPPRPERRRRR